MISGIAAVLGAASSAPAEGFFSRIRSSPREYSNSSKLCSDIVFRSFSICSMSGPADDPPPLDLEAFLRFIRFVLELYEIPRGAGQYFATPFMHHDVVFNPDSPNTRKIHTRFYRNHVSRGKLCFLAPCQPGFLMDFQS